MSTPRPRHVDSAAALGRRLKEARERAGLSQRRLADPGYSGAYISRIEAGERTPSLALVRELARRLGVSEGFLARGEEGELELRGSLSDLELAVRLDEPEEAEQLIRQALSARTDEPVRADALAWQGQLAFRQGEHREARELLEQALELSGDAAPASLRDSLGRAYLALGEDELAIALFQRSLERAEEREDLMESIRFSILLANTLIDGGSLGRAEELLGGALARTHGLEDVTVRARLYWSQSRLHAGRGDAEAAARYARRAIALIELTEDVAYAAEAHQLLAHVELDRGRAQEALEILERGRDLLQGREDPVTLAKFRLEEARALIQLGRAEEAAAIAMEAAGALTEANPLEAGRGYQLLAETFEDLGELGRARELYELAVELLEKRPNRYLVAVYARLGDLLEREGDKDEALRIFKRAVQVQARAGIEPAR